MSPLSPGSRRDCCNRENRRSGPGAVVLWLKKSLRFCLRATLKTTLPRGIAFSARYVRKARRPLARRSRWNSTKAGTDAAKFRREPEGNLWSFGIYWPKADETPAAVGPGRHSSKVHKNVRSAYCPCRYRASKLVLETHGKDATMGMLDL